MKRLGQALSTDELGPQVSGVVDYVLQNPIQAAATAAGSFVGPGFAIKGARGGAALLGAGEKGIQRAGTGAAMTTGGMMAGGDAAGDAYDMVYARTGDAELATKAAREASVVPALIGAVGGRFGAEGALAKGGTKSILKTGAAEFGTEFVEEGSTKLSANLAAGQYVDGINPMTGVAGSALMGGILGGGTGLAVGALTKERSMLPGANTRDVGGDLSTGGKTDGSGISSAINNTDPQGQQFLFGPEQMPDVQGTPRNPYDVGGQVSAFKEQRGHHAWHAPRQSVRYFSRDAVGADRPSEPAATAGSTTAATASSGAADQRGAFQRTPTVWHPERPEFPAWHVLRQPDHRGSSPYRYR